MDKEEHDVNTQQGAKVPRRRIDDVTILNNTIAPTRKKDVLAMMVDE